MIKAFNVFAQALVTTTMEGIDEHLPIPVCAMLRQVASPAVREPGHRNAQNT